MAVFVANGTYYENVVINKTLDLVGEHRNGTITDGGGSGAVVVLSEVDGVNISCLNLVNSGLSWGGAGLYLTNSSYNVIYNCNINNCYFGMQLLYSSHNDILYCNISRIDYYGVHLDSSSSNNLSSCYINNCSQGINFSHNTHYNEVSACEISECSDYGLYIASHGGPFGNYNNTIYNNYFRNSRNDWWPISRR